MMLRTTFRGAALTVCLALAIGAAAQDDALKPHSLFADHMVLQRDMPCPVWGTAPPGAGVTVSVAGQKASARAGADGRWTAKLPPLEAGGPHEMTITAGSSVTLKDVLVGDVWICSGQSNMEQGIAASANPQEEIAAADFPRIRLFTVPKRVLMEPAGDVDSRWLVCTPENISTGGWGGFSAVGYYFGRHLHRELGVPIGLIHSSWGGTVAEAWTSAEALKKSMPDFAQAVEAVEQAAAAMKEGKPAPFEEQIARWWAKNDPGSAQGLGWADPALDDSSWKTMNLPAAWENAGLPGYDGVAWFRKVVELPAAWAGREASLGLGPIDDIDTTWVNGTKVGETGVWNAPRQYKVPAKVLKAGRNVLAIRVLDTGGGGGIYGQPGQMKLAVGGDETPLAGPWKYKDSVPLSKCGPVPSRPGQGNPNVVTVLYNGMIAPLLPAAIRGAIWYQGESNAGRAAQYRTLLPTMIRDWRARFSGGEFPFLIVQLANFMQVQTRPSEGGWAELREAQLWASQTVPKTGIAVITDIGEAADIHPKNKQDVGKRLALNALAIAHGKKIVHSGPIYREMKVRGGKIELRFDHAGGGLVARGDALKGFAIAGEDGNFEWADAVIEGDAVVVSSPKVPQPAVVRYGWASNPIGNLYNKEGLPASPFRTDAPRE